MSAPFDDVPRGWKNLETESFAIEMASADSYRAVAIAVIVLGFFFGDLERFVVASRDRESVPEVVVTTGFRMYC